MSLANAVRPGPPNNQTAFDRAAAGAPITPPHLPYLPAGKHHVLIALTPYAPDCAHLPIEEPRRWIAYWTVTPRQAMAALCERLKRRPADLATLPLAGGDVAILTVKPETVKPLAFVWDLTEQQIRTALEELARGVRP